jgi:hypothetical protein
LRQLLSTSAGLANTGDSNFDYANISTLYVSTISGLNLGTQTLNILNTSSITVSTFRNININGSNITLTSKNVGQFINNGIMLLNNTDPVSGRSAANITNILTGEGSFQALAGNLQLSGSDQLNLYAGNKVLLETAWSQNNLPDGVFDIAGNNLINARSISSIAISTGTLRASDIRANSLSSIFVSTGRLKAGATTVDSLNAGALILSGSLDMCNNNISNVATLGATTGNFTTLTGNLTGNVSGNLTGNVSGNVSGNLTGNVVGNISNTNLTVSGQYSITETADVGSAISNYANYGTVNISGKGGLGGIVNITADVATPLNPAFTVSQMTLESKGNYGNFFITPPDPYLGYFPRGGLVQIIARQGLTPTPPATVVSGLAGNGEIDLTAYSYGTVPGLIKMSAGANAMYAGAFSPITGLFGNNYIAATIANTITAGLPPGGVPTFVGTNYLYGYNGTSVQNGLYVDNILNYGNGITYSNLTIGANNSKDVIITNVKTLNMQNTPTIDGAGTGSINSFSNINSSNLNIYKQAFISSLTVDDIVFNRFTENFDTLFASTIYTSTITGFNNGFQNIRMLNNSSITISTGANFFGYGSNVGFLATTGSVSFAGSNVLFLGSNTMAFDCRGTTQGKVNLLASTLGLYAQNNTLLSANDNQLDLYSGTDTILTTGGIFYANVAEDIRLNTPQVLVQTHLDTPSISTINLKAINTDLESISSINFQATNFQATTTTVLNNTITGTLTAPLIVASTITSANPINVITPSINASGNMNLTSLNATTNVNASFVGATSGTIGTLATTTGNITTVNATNVNTTTTTLQNIKGNPDISISTGTLLLQTTINEPVVITTNFTSYGTFPWVCPPGITSVSITLSGAGGGVNNAGAYSTPGRGGYVSGQYPTTPGQTYNFVVGEGGGVSPAGRQRYGGGGQGTATGCDGGGGTFFTTSAGAVIAAAGGGGGGAAINGSSDNVGGAGGGTTGGMGGGSDPAASPPVPQTGGNGGTQSAAGTAPTDPSSPGNNGSGINGGAGINNTGAGGGGYYGGAGGGDNPPSSLAAGGGGGGSSFSTNLGSAVNTQGGGAAITRNGSASISYSTTDVAPNCIFDAYVDVQNKLTFNEKSIVCWQQGANKTNSGQEWDSGWQNATDPASGMTFSSSEYVMTSALTYTSISQPYAIAWSQVSQQTSGGIWQWQGKLGSATASGTDLQAIWSVQITMIPIELCPGGIVSEVPPIPNYLDIPLNNPYTYLSSITANALTIEAAENISILANLAVPTYISTGSITIGGTNTVAVLANTAVIGGFTDVNIEALTGNINLSASTIINYNDSKFVGSNYNLDGSWVPFRSFFNPPTGSGQSSEIQVSGKAQDAGAITTLRMGVDIPAGLAYINSEWDGYITMPLALNGSQVAVNAPFYTLLGSNSIQQPVIQYGTTSGSGASGTATVSLPVAYTSGASYVAFASMEDSDEAKMAVNRDNLSSITIVWSQGGSGSHTLAWNTMGT